MSPEFFSLEAERALLGALLLDAERALAKAQPLTAEAFSVAEHRTIFAAVAAMVNRGVPVDTVTVFEALKAKGVSVDLGYLSGLSESAAGIGASGRYAGIVRDKQARRELLRASQDALDIASEANGDTADKLDKIAGVFVGLQRAGMARVPKRLADVAASRLTHYSELEEGKVAPAWAIGIPRFDRLLGGGLREGCQYIVAARPSVGKTSLASQIALNMAGNGRTVLILSQEMSADQLADRAIANAAKISMDAILNGRLCQEEWHRAVGVTASDSFARLHIDEQGALTMLDVRSKAKQVPGLSVLILDYLQLCAGATGFNANRNAEIEQVSRGLKALAKEMGIAVVALSQLNREVEKRAEKKPMLADLRDSGAIEQDADAVCMLWTARELTDASKLVGMYVAKNRHGKCGEVALHFDGSQQRWGESTESLETDSPVPRKRRGFDDSAVAH